MTPEEFRLLGRRVVDWVARYMEDLEDVESFPVRAQVEPGQIAAMLPSEAPESPEDWDAILADLDRVILPGVTLGSRRTSLRTSRAMRRALRSWANWSAPGLACRGCCGPRARRVRNWRR